MESASQFESRLRAAVRAHLATEGADRYADRRIVAKAVLFWLLLLFSYLLLLTAATPAVCLAAYALLGLANIFLSINIGHEAIHNCLSRNRALNGLGKLTFALAGVSAGLWGAKHLNAHHRHTNIPELDTDFQQSKLIRLTPDFPKTSFHRYQHLYIPFFYLLYTLHWTYFKDFREMSSLDKRSAAALVMNKLLYVSIFLVIPLIVHHYDPWILAGFIFSYLVTGAFFGLFLIPIHINTYARIQEHHPHSRPGFAAQLASTPNFSTRNPVLNFLLGGFNHHACHHLFPAVSHVHYRHITPLIQALSAEAGIRYQELTYPELIRAHFRYLRQLAKMP